MSLRKYKEELEETKRELRSQTFLLNMTKTVCCDMCMTEAMNYSNPDIQCSADLDKEEHQPVVKIQMGFRTIGLCKRHMRILADELEKELGDINA